MAVIEIKNLRYRYPNTDRFAVNGVSLTIEKGEFIGIVGQNGAGKTTLSQSLIGLVPQFYKGAYGGMVTVCGLDTSRKPISEICQHVGLIFQNPFNQLSGAKDSVYGEVAYGLQNLGVPRQEMKDRVEKVMKQLDIWQYRDRNPFDLSGGQMQRVAIASILVMQPEVIILDEPTSQLDPQGTEEVFRVVDQLSKSGITIIMIEQKLEKMASYCDRIILMNDGKLVAFDTPEKIFSRNDLADIGVLPPAFTRICQEMKLKNTDGTYPATLDRAVELFRRNKLKYNVKPRKMAAHGDANKKVFQVENMNFSYTAAVQIFQKLNLKLDGRATAIIGQNGAGKTTLVRILKGLLKPTGGNVYFGNTDIAGKSVAMLADKVGYVFQNPDDQIFKYKVLDEVMFGPLNIGMPEAQAKEESLKALKLMGLAGKENANPYDLELNERKMVAIASVLAMDTDVIILDEPTIAQDYLGKKLIGEMIAELTKQGKLVIAILHDMDFVYESFERVIAMAHGKVLADGTPEEVFAKADALKQARLQKPYMLQLAELLG